MDEAAKARGKAQEIRRSCALHLPILYNINIGHAFPTGVLPLGVRAEIDCGAKTLTLLESATIA